MWYQCAEHAAVGTVHLARQRNNDGVHRGGCSKVGKSNFPMNPTATQRSGFWVPKLGCGQLPEPPGGVLPHRDATEAEAHGLSRCERCAAGFRRCQRCGRHRCDKGRQERGATLLADER